MTGKCIAYQDNGLICGKPALILDRQRGGMVCPEHALALLPLAIEALERRFEREGK